MNDDDLCSDCGRPIYDYLDADEMEKVDEACEHEKYCCNEKGYPDPNCLELKMSRMRDVISAAKKLIDMTLPKCNAEGCKNFAMSPNCTCDEHGSDSLKEHLLDENQKGKRYDVNYAEALREYLTAREKNGNY